MVSGMTEPFKARQSMLAGLSVCARRTWHDLAAGWDSIRGNVGATGELGTLQHEVCAEILRTLYEQGETEMSTYEAEAIANETYAASSIVLPAQCFDDLIWMTLRFVERPIRADRLLPTEDGPAIEQRIDVPIKCPDGVTRILSCQPDAVFAGADGTTAVVGDWKTSRGKPRTPRQQQEGVPEDTAVGFDYLSPRGHFQAPCYLIAAMHRWPRVQRGVFRESYLRYGLYREFVMDRNGDKHKRFEAMIGGLLMKLERGLSEGADSQLWRPRPGSHCNRQCPVNRSCPIPEEQRGVGAIADAESAEREAARYVMVDGLRDALRAALKDYYQAHGEPIPVGDTGDALSWGGGAGNAFEVVHVPSGVNGNGAEQVNEQPKETAA
jgi:hypothetical protein